MDKQDCRNLKERIIEEMTFDCASPLEEHFDTAKQLLRLTRDGKVDIICKDRLTGEEQILLYLIGKLYAKEAGFAASEDAGNKELMQQLNMPRGSLLPFLKRLRDKDKIEKIKQGKYTYHRIPAHAVGEIFQNIQAKIETGQQI